MKSKKPATTKAAKRAKVAPVWDSPEVKMLFHELEDCQARIADCQIRILSKDFDDESKILAAAEMTATYQRGREFMARLKILFGLAS